MIYLIGEINLYPRLNYLDKKLSKVIVDAYINIKENLLIKEYPIWLCKLKDEYKIINKSYNHQ